MHGDLTAGHVAVIDEFFEQRRRQEELEQRRKEAQERQRARARIISQDRYGRTHARDSRTGRFIRLFRRKR